MHQLLESAYGELMRQSISKMIIKHQLLQRYANKTVDLGHDVNACQQPILWL